MRSLRRHATGLGLLAVAGTVAAVAVAPLFVGASDHLDGPLVQTDKRVDITDIYAWANGTSGRSTLVLNVNPLTSPASTKFAYFRPGALYEIKIDTNLDAHADIAYRVRFSGLQQYADGARFQAFTVKRATGAAADGHAWTGTTVATGLSTAYGHTLRTAAVAGGGTVFAGPRDDPFYFDLVGFKHLKARLLAGSTIIGSPGTAADCPPATTTDDSTNALLSCFTGTDTFAGTNISTIALQLPNGTIGGATHTVGVWATTSILLSAGYQQIDRMGRPAINTVFNITDGQKDLANVSSPADDRSEMLARTKTVLGAFDNVLQVNSLPNYTAAQIDAIAKVLLPDELTYKVGDTHGFAYFVGAPSLANLRLNGRRPVDDVINAEFALVTDFNITSDGVNANDKTFLSSFPYLAAPH
jgi:Domain of unknown function (DUF4331)